MIADLSKERAGVSAAPPPGAGIVIDAFCGIGGNSIQFAAQPNIRRVVSIDNSAARLAMAQTNAGVYGVQDKIDFVNADVTSLPSSLHVCGIHGGVDVRTSFQPRMFVRHTHTPSPSTL